MPRWTETQPVRRRVTGLAGAAVAAILVALPVHADTPVPNLYGWQTYFTAPTGPLIAQAQGEFGAALLGGAVRIGDVESAYNPFHVALRDRGINDLTATMAANGTLTKASMCRRSSSTPCLPAPCEGFGAQHGTSVLSMLVAADKETGMRGIVPAATPIFASNNYYNAGASGRDAIRMVIDALRPGDVLLLEQQGPLKSYPGQGGPADIEDEIDQLVRDATSKGIVVVMGAGNSGLNLDTISDLQAYRLRSDNGAIMVGAGKLDGSARVDISNYGSRVDLYGWGEGIATAGYSYDIPAGRYVKLWPLPPSLPVVVPGLPAFTPDVSCKDTDDTEAKRLLTMSQRPNDYYTYAFGGTSGASAMVAGVAAALQSYAKLNLGKPLTPVALRDLLKRTGNNPVAGIGRMVDLYAAVQSLSGLGYPSPVMIGLAAPFAMTQKARRPENGWSVIPNGSRGVGDPTGPLLLSADRFPAVSHATLHFTVPVPVLGPNPALILTTTSRYHHDFSMNRTHQGIRAEDGLYLSLDGQTWDPVPLVREFWGILVPKMGEDRRCIARFVLTQAIAANRDRIAKDRNLDIAGVLTLISDIRLRFQHAIPDAKAPDDVYDEIAIKWGALPDDSASLSKDGAAGCP